MFSFVISGVLVATSVLSIPTDAAQASTPMTQSSGSVLDRPAARIVVAAKSFSKGKPTISGKAQVGSSLKAKTGNWSPTPTSLTYQWYRDGVAIKGATSRTYKLVAGDVGSKIKVRVTAKRSGVTTTSAYSAKTGSVKKGTLSKVKPKISGSGRAGTTLTAKAGSWAPSRAKLSYQWLRDGKSISGATSSSYKLGSNDAGTKISVKVTGRATGYNTASITSATVSVKASAVVVLSTGFSIVYSGKKTFVSCANIKGAVKALTKAFAADPKKYKVDGEGGSVNVWDWKGAKFRCAPLAPEKMLTPEVTTASAHGVPVRSYSGISVGMTQKAVRAIVTPYDRCGWGHLSYVDNGVEAEIASGKVSRLWSGSCL
ncbi:MAG: hypothetical protein QM622_00090 [Microbacterium sp.]